jgi:hypothetical protein
MTLIEDLESAAEVIRLTRELDSTLGARLREHAKRLREEMGHQVAGVRSARASGKADIARLYKASLYSLERVNGGALATQEKP